MEHMANPRAALVEHGLLDDLRLAVHDCLDALSLEYHNTEHD
jgi:hypothetical protein